MSELESVLGRVIPSFHGAAASPLLLVRRLVAGVRRSARDVELRLERRLMEPGPPRSWVGTRP